MRAAVIEHLNLKKPSISVTPPRRRSEACASLVGRNISGNRYSASGASVKQRRYGITFLGFNNPGDNDWSDDELPPNGVLPDGNSVFVKFNTEDKGCKWNFKIDWADPGYPGVVWHDINLCSITTVTLKYNRDTDTTSAELH